MSRPITLLAAFAFIAAAASGSPGTTAMAAERCDGVWVVVDARDAGGPVTSRCAPGDPTSGLQALQGAGHRFTYVPNLPGFVCTLDALPDPCNGAPATAYWSYWHASAGAGWIYSSTGAGSRDPAPGTVEGWRFGDGSSPPRMDPPANPAPASEQEPEEEAEPRPKPEPETPSTGDPTPQTGDPTPSTGDPTPSTGDPTPPDTTTPAPSTDGSGTTGSTAADGDPYPDEADGDRDPDEAAARGEAADGLAPTDDAVDTDPERGAATPDVEPDHSAAPGVAGDADVTGMQTARRGPAGTDDDIPGSRTTDDTVAAIRSSRAPTDGDGAWTGLVTAGVLLAVIGGLGLRHRRAAA